MKFEKDEVIILGDGIEYLIIDMAYYNNNKYLYLAKLNENKYSIVKLVNREESVLLSKLDDAEYDAVLNIFIEQNKESN